jgi:magnesium-transporting ATPase (P-type)
METNDLQNKEPLMKEASYQEVKTDTSIKNERQPKKIKYTVNVNSRVITKKKLNLNRIRTSKYNYFNAIPKILCEQFSKVSNIYFLGLAILQMIPVVSPSGGSPIMLIPLIFVVLVNGIKDFIEDLQRNRSDERENKSKCIHLEKNITNKVHWETLNPGDIVKVKKDEYFPADLVLLYSPNKAGVAYVETKNLDGETNLKYKDSVKMTYNIIKQFENESERDEVIGKTYGNILCDQPNTLMYSFDGVYYYENRSSILSNRSKSRNSKKGTPKSIRKIDTYNFEKNTERIIVKDEDVDTTNKRMRFESFSNDEFNETITEKKTDNNITTEDIDRPSKLDKRVSQIESDLSQNYDKNVIPLDYNSLLLRGSSLRNTEYIYGVVIYAGHNTKIMMNSLNARTKQSRVFRTMNSQLKLIIIIQLCICLAFSVFYSIDPEPFDGIFFEETEYNFKIIALNFIFSFCAWLLVIANIVPISLLVTLEMIKFCQALFISWDFKMYDKANNRQCTVQSSGLNEELGQIHVKPRYKII